MRSFRLSAGFLAVISIVGTASAADTALAETLFQEGKRLMDAKKYAEACPKLAESQRIDPAGGTLVLLALCHDGEGKTATAWSEFQDALAQAKREGRTDREAVAKERIAALEPRLVRLSITVHPETAALPGVEVRRGGVLVGRAAWGVSSPVDPGETVIQATAPGRQPWTSTVTVGRAAVTVAVPVLKVAEATPAVPATDVAPPSSGRRVAGIVVGAIGVVGLGVGSYFGLKALSLKSDANGVCPDKTCDDAAARGKSHDALVAANVANVGMGLGLLGVGVGAYLLVTSGGQPAGASPRESVALTGGPTVSSNSAGWTFRGRF